MFDMLVQKNDTKGYAEVAAWCTANNAMLVDNGDYYMVVPRPTYEATKEDQLKALTQKLDTIKKAYQGAQLMGTDTTQLQREYKETVDKIKALQKEGVTIAD